MDTVLSPDASTEDTLLSEVSTLARRYAVRSGDEVEEDLAQDVVLHCLIRMRARKWRIDVSLPALIRAMVRRRRIDAIRRDKRRASRNAEHARERAQSTHAWMKPDLALEEQQLESLYEQTMARLPRRCRRVYEMVREQGVSYRTTADRIGISRAAVNKYVVEAQRQFRTELREYGIETSPASRARGSQAVGPK